MQVATINAKVELGKLICDYRIGAWEAHKRLQLGYRTVTRYARMVRMDIPFRSYNGRPRSLTDEDVQELITLLAEKPETTTQELKHEIQKRYQINFKRLHPEINVDVQMSRKLSKRTVSRYLLVITAAAVEKNNRTMEVS